MPNGKTHFIAGAVVGATVNVLVQSTEMAMDYDRPFDWGEFFLCTGAGAFAGLGPDILEPATSPNHRRFFHGVIVAALVAWAISGKHTLKLSRAARLALWVFGTSYLSHIALTAPLPSKSTSSNLMFLPFPISAIFAPSNFPASVSIRVHPWLKFRAFSVLSLSSCSFLASNQKSKFKNQKSSPGHSLVTVGHRW